MIPMNFMKSKAGFTLVELIVVIAILGILAGIAVPAYSGYIKKANNAADTATLAAVKTACESACALEDNVEKIVVTAGNDGSVTTVAVHYDASAAANHTFAYSSGWTCSTTHATGVSCPVNDFSIYMNGGTVTLKASSAATLSGGAWALTPKS